MSCRARRYASISLAVVLVAGVQVGCGDKDDAKKNKAGDKTKGKTDAPTAWYAAPLVAQTPGKVYIFRFKISIPKGLNPWGKQHGMFKWGVDKKWESLMAKPGEVRVTVHDTTEAKPGPEEAKAAYEKIIGSDASKHRLIGSGAAKGGYWIATAQRVDDLWNLGYTRTILAGGGLKKSGVYCEVELHVKSAAFPDAETKKFMSGAKRICATLERLPNK